jgi:hypothetical protein
MQYFFSSRKHSLQELAPDRIACGWLLRLPRADPSISLDKKRYMITFQSTGNELILQAAFLFRRNIHVQLVFITTDAAAKTRFHFPGLVLSAAENILFPAFRTADNNAVTAVF